MHLLFRVGRVMVVFYPWDFWVGYYRSGEQHWVCVVPMITITWPRRGRRYVP